MPLLPIGPLDDEWEVPKGNGPKFLFKYMRQQQVETYGKYYTALRNSIQLRNIGYLCKKYNDDDIKRAIAYGCLVSEHPFSTAFIKKVLEKWLKDTRSNPTVQFYQNKS